MINLFSYGNLKSARQLYFELGLSFAAKGDNEKAVGYLQSALNEKDGVTPDETEINIALGNTLLKTGNNAAALQLYLQAALASLAYFNDILTAVGDHLDQQTAASISGWIEENWEPAIQRIPITASMQDGLDHFSGKYCLLNGEYSKAEHFFSAILESHPDDCRALKGLGEIYLEQNNFSKAKEKFLAARKQTEGNAALYNTISVSLAQTFLQAGDYEKALTEIDGITEGSKTEDDTNMLDYYRATAYSGLQQYAKANEMLDKLLTGNYRAINYHLLRIQNYIALHDYSKSLSLVEQAFQIDTINNDLQFLKIQCLIEGAMDIAEGKRLFSETRYGYLELEGKEKCFEKITEILRTRLEDGNAFFFASYIYFLIDPQHTNTAEFMKRAEALIPSSEDGARKAGLFLLKAEMDLENKNMDEAAANFFEAAKSYYWKGSFTDANKYFERAIALKPAMDEAYKYNADTLFISSFRNEPPYNDSATIEKSLDCWRSAPKQVIKDAADAWHYIVMARIHEAKYKFVEKDFYNEYWSAVLYGERAVIRDPGDFSLWVYLGRFYRNLEFEFNSRAAFVKAAGLNSTDTFFKEEKVILDIVSGAFDESLAWFAELKQKPAAGTDTSQPGWRSMEGYVIFHFPERLEEAIVIFDDVIRNSNDYIFAHYMKMSAHWQAGQLPAAKKEAIEIMALEKKYAYAREDVIFAWSYFIAGEPEKAIKRLQEFVEQGESPDNIAFSLAQFYLLTENLAAAETSFALFLQRSNNIKAPQELLQCLAALELQFKEANPSSHDSVKKIAEIIVQWRRRLNERIAVIKQTSITPSMEFTMRMAEGNFAAGTLPYITMQAGLARLYRNEQNLPEAYRIYKKLEQFDTEFPEAIAALEDLETEIDKQTLAGINRSEFSNVVELLAGFDIQKGRSGFRKAMLLSLAYFGNRNEAKSLEYMAVFFASMLSDANLQESALAFFTKDAYHAGISWDFACFVKAHCPDKLQGWGNDFVSRLINKSIGLQPYTTPIIIEISKDLVSAVSYEDDWYVIKKLIPAMKDNIARKFGVQLPGVRMRPNEGLAPGAYLILLDEIPTVMTTTGKGKLFITHAEMDIQTLSITGDAGYNPVSGRDSLWVDASLTELLDKNGIQYWSDPFVYMIAHLEAVLSYHLDLFIDTQFCYDYLAAFNDDTKNNVDADLSQTAAGIQNTPALLIQFCRVLTGLIKEKIPLKSKAIILQSFNKANALYTEANDIIRHLRMDLKDDLPVNVLSLKQIELPQETADKIRAELIVSDGKIFLEMTPENCRDRLAEIKEIAGDWEEQAYNALIVKDADLRIHVRKMTESSFPLLHIVAAEELNKKINTDASSVKN